MIGISSCLCGKNCTYSGQNNLIDIAKKLVESDQAIMFCPEVLGGLSVPRDPCEIIDNKVMSIQGKDYTKEYLLGATRALKVLKDHNVDVVLTKFRSPSCGKGAVYDGTFSHTLISGDGITTQLLLKNDIKVFTDYELDEFLAYIKERGIEI